MRPQPRWRDAQRAAARRHFSPATGDRTNASPGTECPISHPAHAAGAYCAFDSSFRAALRIDVDAFTPPQRGRPAAKELAPEAGASAGTEKLVKKPAAKRKRKGG